MSCLLKTPTGKDLCELKRWKFVTLRLLTEADAVTKQMVLVTIGGLVPLSVIALLLI